MFFQRKVSSQILLWNSEHFAFYFHHIFLYQIHIIIIDSSKLTNKYPSSYSLALITFTNTTVKNICYIYIFFLKKFSSHSKMSQDIYCMSHMQPDI